LIIRDPFTDQELAAIRAATEEAEKQTGGELVCVIVQRCDTYEASAWKATSLGAVGGALAAGLWQVFGDVWIWNPLPWILLPPVLGAAFGLLTVWIAPPLRRLLIPPAVLQRRVDRRAATAFLNEEIFDTRERTGVLLFVALFEHQIRILRDQGIDKLVPEEEWAPIIANLTRSLRVSDKGEAIIEAIQACGQLLATHGVARRPDDLNELGDAPRLYDE